MPLTFNTAAFLMQVRQNFEQKRQLLGQHTTRTAEQVQADIVERTPVDTGALRDSWFLQSTSPLQHMIGTNVSYAPDVEFGLYRRVGPKTVQMPGGIFSRQAPRGMVRITLEEHRKPFLDGIAQILRAA